MSQGEVMDFVTGFFLMSIGAAMGWAIAAIMIGGNLKK
jgi:hypothetical protein